MELPCLNDEVLEVSLEEPDTDSGNNKAGVIDEWENDSEGVGDSLNDFGPDATGLGVGTEYCVNLTT